MTDQLLGVHEWWAWVTVLANAVAGLWCLGAHWIPALRIRQLWWFVGAAEVTIFVVNGVDIRHHADQKRLVCRP